eukprot:symbB.v1.2.037198.t2/scaffold5427.1/size27340/1
MPWQPRTLRYSGLLGSSIGNDYAWHARPFNELYTRKFSEVLAMASSRMLVPASPQEADLGEMEEVEEVDVEEAEGPWKRTRAFMVPAVGLVLLAVGILGIFAAGHVTHGVQEQGIIEEVEEFKIPELPPNPLDELKKEAVAPLTDFRNKYDINPLRANQISLCVSNLNLGLWKVVQLGSLIVKTAANCPAGHLALFPAAENQMALFCPKNSLEQTVIQGGVTTEDAGERRLEANASSFVDRFLQEMPDMPQPPPKPVDKVFCAWNVAESFWFFTRIPPLIDIATRRCPAKKSSKAACSEVINNILTMMFNSVKLMAAASTNCVDGMNVAAGCTAGTLNFMSGITGISWVTSAFANGACTDLDAKRKAATEARINKKINKINLIKDATLRRLLREKKLSGSAITEAHKVIAQDEADIRNNATTEQLVRRLVPDLDLENADPHELAMSYLQGVKPPTDSEHQQMMATLQMLHDKYSTKDDDSKRPPLRGVQGYAFLASSSRPVKSTPYLGLLESSIGNDYAWHACPFNEVVNSLASKVVVRMRLGPGRLWQNGGCGGLRESDESPIGRCQSPQ